MAGDRVQRGWDINQRQMIFPWGLILVNHTGSLSGDGLGCLMCSWSALPVKRDFSRVWGTRETPAVFQLSSLNVQLANKGQRIT